MRRPRGQRHPVDGHHGAVAGLGGSVRGRGGVRHRPRRGQIEVRDQQRLLELGAPRDQAALGVDDDRIAVEDQLVLAAHHVHVGQRRAGLAGPPGDQFQPGLVLAPFVGGRVRYHQQPRARLPGHRDRAAVLPQVLADGDGHVHRVLAAARGDPDHRQPVPGHEVAVLVEHPVVRQVMLGRGDRHRPAVQQRGRVLGGADRLADPGCPAGPPAQVAGDHGDAAEPAGGQLPRRRLQGGDRGVHERVPQRQVLHRVAGQHHLREHDEVGAGVRGAPGPRRHRCGVPRQVADGRVHLGKGDPQPGHPCTLIGPRPCPSARPPRRPSPAPRRRLAGASPASPAPRRPGRCAQLRPVTSGVEAAGLSRVSGRLTGSL